MNSDKLAPTLLILLVGGLAWWLTRPPAGLHESASLAAVAETARTRLGDDSIQIKDLREGLLRNQWPESWEADRIAKVRVFWIEFHSQAGADRAPWKAWRLFLLFAVTIAMVLVNVAPVFVLAAGALSLAILLGLVTPSEGFRGYSESFIILIVVAFTIATAVSKSGLGKRIAFWMISQFGGSTLGLGYSLLATDLLIAPAFPSNTARSGVLFPIVNSIALNSGSQPIGETRRKLGAFLMLGSIVSLSLSSGLWLTAMSANSAGLELVKNIAGVEIGFLDWLKCACVPTLAAAAICPWLLYRIFPPTLTKTPEAKRMARDELRKMGPMGRDEAITAAVFLGLVVFWSLSKHLGLNTAAIAILGLFVLTWTGVLTVGEATSSNGPATFVWFGALYSLAAQLDEQGFMDWVGQGVASVVTGLPWQGVYLLLIAAYIVIHYGFVSQTAHLLAVLPVFLQVGVSAGVPPKLMGMMLLLTTNFFSPLTPVASSANAIFVGSGYLQMGEIYRHGGVIVLCNAVIYSLLGGAWLWWLIQ